MELRQLKYAVKIAEEKNFSRAAAKLHIAQPSLSQQLSKLEKELGVRLFTRNTNAVELTHAGKLFIDKAQKVLDIVEQIHQEMDDISKMRKGKLLVGSLPITGSHILPQVLPAFKAKYPDIEISLIEDTTANLEMLTATGQADISLLSLPLQDKSLEYVKIIEEEIWLCVPQNHRLNKALINDPKYRVSLQELKDESFIVLKKGQGFRQIVMDLCASAGFAPKIVFESSNIDTVQSLVAAGMGIAFVPKMVARTEGQLIPAYLPIEGANTARTLVIAYKKGRYLSKAAKAFIETATEVLCEKR
mgnify:CR=1 FL=1